MMKLVPVLVLAGLLISCQPEKEPVSTGITAYLDTTYTTIGDVVHFSVVVTAPETNQVQFPPLKLDDPVEVRTSQKSNVSSGTGRVFELVFWDTGAVAIPPYEVRILSPDSTLLEKLASDTLWINVVSVAETDPNFRKTGGELKPIKAPVPVTLPWPWKKISLVAALFFTIIGMFWTWSRRITGSADLENDEEIILENPDIHTLEQLKKLEREFKEHHIGGEELYTRLSLILREYVELSLYIRTLSMTTEEIRDHRDLFPYNDDEFQFLSTILAKADLVKFARQKLPKEDGIADLDATGDFVEKTTIYWKMTEATPESGVNLPSLND